MDGDVSVAAFLTLALEMFLEETGNSSWHGPIAVGVGAS
jgi:hypothetical protein